MPDPGFPGKKEFDPKEPNPCLGCSNFCEYVSIEVDKPTTPTDFDEIIWYLVHKDVWVYVDDDGDWHAQFNTPCDKLEDQRCGYYPHRPQLCRDYEPKTCVRYGEGDAEKYLFKNEVDLYRYLAKKRPKMYDKIKKKNNLPFKKKELLEDKHAHKVSGHHGIL